MGALPRVAPVAVVVCQHQHGAPEQNVLVPDGPAGCPGAALGLGFAGEPRQFHGAFWKAGLARRVTSASQVAASRRSSTGEAPGSRPQRRLLSRRAPGPPAGLSLALLSLGGPWQERRLSSERRAWVMRRGDPRGLVLPGLLPCAGFPARRCGAANEALMRGKDVPAAALPCQVLGCRAAAWPLPQLGN